MPNKFDKVQVHLYIDRQIAETFQRLYSECRPRFVQNAMELAINDKTFFEKIFFKDIYPRS